MRWKAHFLLDGDDKENNTKKSFGFKSRYHPPPCTELEHFEKDLINIINNIKFTNNKNSFQKKLRAGITEIKNSRNIDVFVDKTNNFYKIPTSEHIIFWKKILSKFKNKLRISYKNQSTWKQNPQQLTWS